MDGQDEEPRRWPLDMWAEAQTLPDREEHTYEAMRDDLLEVRDTGGFDFTDEEAVFAYFADWTNVVPGEGEAEWSALEIAQEWQRHHDEQPQTWPLWMWTDAKTRTDRDYEAMREDLLEARDAEDLAFTDEEPVFAYLEDPANELPGDEVAEWSALAIAQLWQRRYVQDYGSWRDRADQWLEHDEAVGFWDTLYRLASDEQRPVLDALLVRFGREWGEVDRDQYCYIDRISTHGELLCLARRDAEDGSA